MKDNAKTDVGTLATYNPRHLNPFGASSILDDFFSNVWDGFWNDPGFLTQRNWRPTDTWEDNDNIHVEIELPRFKKEEVSVEVKNRAVVVNAKNERSSFQRMFTFSGVDYDKISGELKDGVLSITLPKTPESKARKLEIK